MSQWNSALNVRRVQAQHLKCRVKYNLYLSSDHKAERSRSLRAQCGDINEKKKKCAYCVCAPTNGMFLKFDKNVLL